MSDNQLLTEIAAKEEPDVTTSVIDGLKYADQFISQRNLENISAYSIEKPSVSPHWYREIGLIKVDKVIFNDEENIIDKLVSVYGVLNGADITLMMIVESSPQGVDLYFGVRDSDFCFNC